jgi:hypothetical protein
MHPSGIIEESSVSLELCLTCRCLTTTAFDQTYHNILGKNSLFVVSKTEVNGRGDPLR